MLYTYALCSIYMYICVLFCLFGYGLKGAVLIDKPSFFLNQVVSLIFYEDSGGNILNHCYLPYHYIFHLIGR